VLPIIARFRVLIALTLISTVATCSHLRAASKDLPSAPFTLKSVSIENSNERISNGTLDLVKSVLIIENRTGKGVNILKVTGDCACFSGAEFDPIVSVGGESRVSIFLDRNKMGSSRYKTTLAVSYKLEDSEQGGIQALEIEVPFVHESALLLPPISELSIQSLSKENFIVEFQILLNSGETVAFGKPQVISKLRGLVGSTEIIEFNDWLYDGKWRRVGKLRVSFNPETVQQMGTIEKVLIRCFLNIGEKHICLESSLTIH